MTIIQTPHLLLRPWFDEDAVVLYKYASDPRVGPPAGWPPHTSVDDSRRVIRDILSAPETYAVVLRATGEPVGSVGIMRGHGNGQGSLSPEEAEIGYWIGVPFWGRGLIPEAVEALLDRCFITLGCTSVYCSYFDGNGKSRRVQEKCGFLPHHTEDISPNPLNGASSIHFTCQTRERWQARRVPGQHAMRLVPSAFAAIRSGEKTVEMRLFDPKRQAVRVGDTVTFTQTVTGETLTALVTDMRVYPDFAALYAAEDTAALGYRPGQAASPEDMSVYYTPEAIARWGALAMEVSVLPSSKPTHDGHFAEKEGE